MGRTTQIIIAAMLAFLLTGCAATGKKHPKNNLPLSREVTLIESTNPAEVMVLATGIGEGKKKNLTDNAILDARRAAVYFILLGGTDPLLQTQEERDKFTLVQEKVFAAKQINRYISWESNTFENRVKIARGKKLKIQKYFKINKKLLREDLSADGVLIQIEGPLPFIMVIPEVPKGESPIERMLTDPNLKKAAEVIESYLTARRYDVQVPKQAAALNELSDAIRFEQGVEEDYGYQLALSIGSDVYMTYTVEVVERKIGSSTVRKGIVGVRAFETTTARLLGTETGYSAERSSADAVVIEEALNDAIDKVLSRISAYWKEDLNRGVQYKLIFSIEGDFDEDEREDIAFAISDLIEELCSGSRENVVTENTLDYLVWARADQFRKSSKLYRALKEGFPDKFEGGMLKRININRKLILMKIVEAE
ncbi:MAG: hypothetical protein J7M27_11640 [Candidatus Latescibacteria bacterium]|nr:hypothetical protein [Candidatus Latescibacterota bacterium]